MLKREFRINFKSFMIWTFILLGIFLLIFSLYPSIMNGDNAKMMDQFMKVFPEEVLKAFNMDIASINTTFGWLKTEGYIFIILLTGVFSALLGSSILLKEESDNTIEFLHSKPITRNKILNSKVIVGVVYIALMIIVLAIFNYSGLLLLEDFNTKEFFNLSLAPILSSLAIFFICLLISTFFHKTKKTSGISLAVVFISYFLMVFASISEKVEVLKYLSVFTLSEARTIIDKGYINLNSVIITIIIIIICYFTTRIIYNKKELA